MTKARSANLRIGMISRLSGVPTATIRMWERRYEALNPQRSPAGGRLYSTADVARLALLKQLVDRGHAIGTVAGLSESRLQQLLADSATPVAPVKGDCRIAIVGSSLSRRMKPALSAHPRMVVAGTHATVTHLLATQTDEALDAVVVEIPSLGPTQAAQLLELLQKLRPRLLIVLYAFGAERDLGPLNLDSVLLLKGRMEARQLLRICLLSLSMQQDAQQPAFDALVGRTPPRRAYSESELVELAASRNTIRCECPRHLSDLLLSLGAFELYSSECQNRNERDAAVHAMLRSASGHARSLLEEALKRVIAIEGQLEASA